MEEWNSSRVEEWKSSRVEKWNSSRVEEWKSGMEKGLLKNCTFTFTYELMYTSVNI